MKKIGPIKTLTALIGMGILAFAGCNKPDPEHRYDRWRCVGFANGTKGCAEYDQAGHVSSFTVRAEHGPPTCVHRPGHENECNAPGHRNIGVMDDMLKGRVENLIRTEKEVMYGIDKAVEKAKKDKKE